MSVHILAETDSPGEVTVWYDPLEVAEALWRDHRDGARGYPPFRGFVATKDVTAMNSRKYRAGQTVTMTPNRARATPKGRFEVVRLMPAEHGNYQYRIRSVMDGHERVVQESELD
jgi:hypothetical protein